MNKTQNGSLKDISKKLQGVYFALIRSIALTSSLTCLCGALSSQEIYGGGEKRTVVSVEEESKKSRQVDLLCDQ